MANRKVVVKQDAEKPVPTEVLAKDIRAIAQGMRALRRGPLKDSTLALLINDSIRSTDRPGQQVIRLVLDAIEGLEEAHCKKSAKG